MPDSTQGFRELCERARSGCPEAARELYDRYSKEILFIIRRKLDPRLRVLYDSQDFLQETWQVAFTRALKEQFFSSPKNLVAFLCRVAAHKVYDANRHHLDTMKADVVGRLSLDATVRADQEPIDPHADSVALAEVEAAWTKFLEDLLPSQRNLLRLLFAGYTPTAIAQKFNTALDAVHVAIRCIRSQLPVLLRPSLSPLFSSFCVNARSVSSPITPKNPHFAAPVRGVNT